MLDDLLVCEIRDRLNRAGCRDPALPFHERVENRFQRIIIPDNSSGTVDIACDRDKTVRCAGEIDFKSELPVVDVIDRLVVRKIWRQSEETTETGTTGTALKVCIREKRHDGRRDIIKAAIFPDAVIDINRSDAFRHTVTDAVITAHCIGLHGCVEICECRCIIRFCHLPRCRVIRHFRSSAVPLFHLPKAEGGVIFQFCRDVHKIY